jgi:hypothetical protein
VRAALGSLAPRACARQRTHDSALENDSRASAGHGNARQPRSAGWQPQELCLLDERAVMSSLLPAPRLWLRRGAGARTSSRDAIRKRSTLGSAVLMKPSSKDACALGSAGWPGKESRLARAVPESAQDDAWQGLPCFKQGTSRQTGPCKPNIIL